MKTFSNQGGLFAAGLCIAADLCMLIAAAALLGIGYAAGQAWLRLVTRAKQTRRQPVSEGTR